MTHYTYLFSPATYDSCSRSDKTVAGVRKNQEVIARRVQVGDRLVCYVTSVSRWAGILEVSGPVFEDATPKFVTVDDPFTIRFSVKTLVWLSIEKAVPVKAPNVWSSLSITKNAQPTSSAWTGLVRRSLNRIEPADARLLEDLLRQQVDGGVMYPQDEEAFRRLIAKPVRREDKTVAVTVPVDDEADGEVLEAEPATIRESSSVQALLARIGETMGFKVWLPKGDRLAVQKEWTPGPGVLIDHLPLNYDETTLQTIEQIDVLWLKGRSIVRAFEVEHTTAIYSGLLRMADLLSLVPNMDIKLHIVAPEARKEKVFTEIRRPVFSLLERAPLAERCTYISYDSLRELAKLPHLAHTSDSVLTEYEEEAE
jgi:hypothetical protein